jgi:hypothetical protein
MVAILRQGKEFDPTSAQVAGSLSFQFSVARQSSELLANAIIADNVITKVRASVTVQTCNS